VKNLLSRLRSWSWKQRLAYGSLAGFGLLVVLLVLGYLLTSVPQPSSVATDQATKLTYVSGTPMGTIGKNRTMVDLKHVSLDAQRAVLAAEDRGFYSEPGISPKGIARALFTNVRAGGVSQGGSTITQQYAKNAFLTQKRTFTRKIKEVFIAVKMSQTVSKDTILDDYLNTIYFGRGAYGIEAAAQTYFGRGVHAADLDVAQSAVLASSIRSPAGYDPSNHPEQAKARWRYVLDGMVSQKWLTAADRAKQVYPHVQTRAASSASFLGSLDYIRDQVFAELEQHGYSEERIAEGGLTVRTTIDKAAQQAAVSAMEDKLPAPHGTNYPVGALVSIEPGTGRVRAYYGGRQAGGFDYASHSPGVQPGSSMKPYVLATALTEGKSLATTYNGASHQDICGQKDVKNDAGDPAFGRIDLSTALEFSVNTVYLHLACDVGPAKVRDLAHAAGIADSQKLDGDTGTPTAQIALGSGGYEVRPVDQADGYATFAAQGMHAAPFFIESITDSDGNVPYQVKLKPDRAFSSDVAADVVSAMRKVVSGGTATRAQLAGGRPTAGKTGTTSNNTNAWFCGITPQLSTSVWVGMARGGRITGLPGVTGGVYGGKVPAQIFKAYMDQALAGQPDKDFPSTSGAGASATPSSTPSATATPTPSPSPSVVVTTPAPVQPTSPPPLLPTLLGTPPTPSPTPTPTASPTATG
jgi:membrane peptidoglycan carboxypeptidase